MKQLNFFCRIQCSIPNLNLLTLEQPCHKCKIDKWYATKHILRPVLDVMEIILWSGFIGPPEPVWYYVLLRYRLKCVNLEFIGFSTMTENYGGPVFLSIDFFCADLWPFSFPSVAFLPFSETASPTSFLLRYGSALGAPRVRAKCHRRWLPLHWMGYLLDCCIASYPGEGADFCFEIQGCTNR